MLKKKKKSMLKISRKTRKIIISTSPSMKSTVSHLNSSENKEEEVDERPDPKRGVVSDSEPNNLPEPAVPSREPTSEEAESES